LHPRLASARQILVVTKFRYLGDNIVATPFLRRLHEALPDARVTLLAGPFIPTLLQGCPYLSDVIPFDPKGSARTRRNLALVRDLKSLRFDAAFLVNRSLHSAMVAALARIPVRIGFDTEHRGPLLTRRVPYDWSKRDLDCALDLLRAEGLPAEPALPELWVSPEEHAAADERLRSLGIEPGALLVGVQAGANDPHVREWGAEKFAAVADHLSETRGARVLLFGSEAERPVSERTAALMKRPAEVLAGRTGLREALALISRCGLWVGNDGGLLHAAAALCPASVGIFGPTKAPRWGYDAPRHRTVAFTPEEPVTDAAGIRRCLDAVTVDQVLAVMSNVVE
jgi:heptosyltransferase-2